MEKVIIRELEESELEEARKVLRLSFRGKELHWALNDLKYTYVLAALLNGRVMGVVELFETFSEELGGVGVIDYIAVSPRYRRRGIASKLITSSEELFKSWSESYVAASTKGSNIASINLFRKLGYKEVRRGEEGFEKLKYLTYAYGDDIIFIKRLRR
ncbi:MAG: hypothetical protein B6U69_02580 [Thermofilum sp. ex4484_15]|nr:MAG: hypothetical protein B6U69_02580 [Thermofilum sp. ex4484_15]